MRIHQEMSEAPYFHVVFDLVHSLPRVVEELRSSCRVHFWRVKYANVRCTFDVVACHGALIAAILIPVQPPRLRYQKLMKIG